MKQTVYLVKFDCGYYAAKQPDYDWSFTDDPSLAMRYKTLRPAINRAKDGLAIGKSLAKMPWRQDAIYATKYTIIEYEVVEIMTMVSVVAAS